MQSVECKDGEGKFRVVAAIKDRHEQSKDSRTKKLSGVVRSVELFSHNIKYFPRRGAFTAPFSLYIFTLTSPKYQYLVNFIKCLVKLIEYFIFFGQLV